MTVPVVLAIAGAFALLLGVWGGGVKVKEVEIPPAPPKARWIVGIIGLIFIGISIWLSVPTSNGTQPTQILPVITPTLSSIVVTETSTSTPKILPVVTSTLVSVASAESPTSETPASTVIASAKCSANLLTQPWHLEATDDADEARIDFSDQYILKDKTILRVTYNLHGLIAQIGDRKNDSVIVFNQPDWYGISLANPKYGTNGLDGEQTIDIPLSDFVELPNPDSGIYGGKPLDLNSPVSSIRARFWHTGHFIVDITSIAICSSP